MSDREARVECRACGGSQLHRFLDLGDLPVVNALPWPGDDLDAEPRMPVRVAMCPACALVQLEDDADPTTIFDDTYPYHSSVSSTLRDHSEHHAVSAIEERSLGADSLVVEVGCNDGYLLRPFHERGVPVLGIDPASGPVGIARDAGLQVIEAFFDESVAAELVASGVQADLVLANNVLAHVPDPVGLLSAIARLVGPGGEVRIENPWVHDLIEGCQFDTIYQEHYSYLSCTSVAFLAETAGLRLVDVEHFQHLHGGTLRWTLARDRDPSPEVARFLELEAEWGVGAASTYDDFAARVAAVREDLTALLRGIRDEGGSVAAYGAAAKAAVMANVCGLTTDLVDFVVDRDPGKQGRLLPGTHQPVRAPEEIDASGATHLLVFVWNLIDEIRAANQPFADRGGRFIVPVPHPHVMP